MTFSFKFAREIGGCKKRGRRRRRRRRRRGTFFFYPFSSFSTQFPRLRSAFGLASLGMNSRLRIAQNQYFKKVSGTDIIFYILTRKS